MAQHIIPAAQLVPKFQGIRRCNNYVMLQNNPFVALVNIEIIESYMHMVGYQGVVDKKYPSISQRHDEDYLSIKDDILLVSVYSTENVLFRGMRILDAFLTNDMRATNDYKKTTPRAHKTPTLTAVSPQGKKRKQSAREISSPRKSLKVTIKQKPKTTSIPPPSDDKESEEDEESYASTFANFMLNDDDDVDSDTKIVPRSHKENLEVVDDDDDVNVIKKKDDEKNDEDVEKTDVVAKEKYNDATGSMETRNEQMQTPIPTPNRSLMKDLSFDKIITEELTATVSPTTATTSKDSSKSKSKKGFTYNKTKILPASIAGMCRQRGQIITHIKTKFATHKFFMGKIREVLDHCNNVVPALTFVKTNEMIKEEMPRLVALIVQKDREIASTSVPELISK
nr:hypothetical protein [Tanacetum cinerariifolium]GEX16828.1 hypothetical protein [Tanacetum cinerariifolium]GEX16829.1 hypothetical protein [Tanacetum cinerariifolium]GEX16830.1 hypothetical protein [Tanacetum cinerariifolium]